MIKDIDSSLNVGSILLVVCFTLFFYLTYVIFYIRKKWKPTAAGLTAANVSAAAQSNGTGAKADKKHLAIIADEAKQQMEKTLWAAYFLLGFGILTATLGIIISYIEFKGMAKELESPKMLATGVNTLGVLIQFIRPALLLIFIEFFAMFFLRQYRNLIMDYKYYYHIYLKRSNYIVLEKLLEEKFADDNINKQNLVSDMLEDNADTDKSAVIADGNTNGAIADIIKEALKKLPVK